MSQSRVPQTGGQGQTQWDNTGCCHQDHHSPLRPVGQYLHTGMSDQTAQRQVLDLISNTFKQNLRGWGKKKINRQRKKVQFSSWSLLQPLPALLSLHFLSSLSFSACTFNPSDFPWKDCTRYKGYPWLSFTASLVFLLPGCTQQGWWKSSC